MSQMTRFASTSGLALALCAAFAGCSSRTNVSVTGSTPSQFTHVFITTAEVWFNTNENAGPDDSGWAKFPLKTPVTVDLVQQSNGTLGEVADDLRLAPGTYKTILLMPYVSDSPNATASALAAGATYNQEADFVDTVTGNPQQVVLVIPNPEKGIVVPGGTLTVPVGRSGGLPVGGTGTTANTTNQATGLFGQPTTINPTTTTNTTNTTNTTSNTTTTVSFASNFDGNRDVHLFNYTGCTAPLGSASATAPVCGSQQATSPAVGVGAMLSSNPTASDLSTTGGITGTLTLTSTTSPLTNVTAASDRVAISASAEAMSADGSHHVIVATAPVLTDGTFTLYPLQSNSKNPVAYDVVIHGPNIATIIIKSVTVTTTTPTITPAAANSSGAVATTTASGAVSIGTFIPRPAQSFLVQVVPTSANSLPAGAAVTFYQTLPGSGEYPYAIDEVGVDPFNLNLAVPEQLSTQSIDTGTYSSSGSTIMPTKATPAEGAGTYKVGATAPLFTDGTISPNTVVTASTSGTTTNILPSGTDPTPLPATVTSGSSTLNLVPAMVTVPALSPANSAATGSLVVGVNPVGGSTQGQLLVSHNGSVVASASLSGVLLNGGTVTVPNLPGGTNYYLSAIVWSATDPTLKYESLGQKPVSVSAGGQTQVPPVTVN